MNSNCVYLTLDRAACSSPNPTANLVGYTNGNHVRNRSTGVPVFFGDSESVYEFGMNL
ncbi:hypothetical protein KCTCHS21_44710 [Cohnella abietis]|uniref:Uncharacterized protein n=1 Tax=Cohnella abietis TaxID=2507935 RepID=A0A3T1DAE2_9BACL|nr:hypothetical protein KCTCHS21_44710 [Cohnella abietis]